MSRDAHAFRAMGVDVVRPNSELNAANASPAARATPWAARLPLATGTVVGAELVLALTLGPLAHHG